MSYVNCKEIEQERINKLLSALENKGHTEWESTPREGKVKGMLTFQITDKYFRAIAKIGFHYFLKYMRMFRGDEEAFSEIRKFITEGGDISKFVSYSAADKLIGFIPDGYGVKTFRHILIAKATYEKMYCQAQFFLGPGFDPIIYTIHLGNNPMRIIAYQECGHAFVYDEKISAQGACGEVKELKSISKKLLI
ncbi:MAG TPA: hypothetical protein VFZ34_29295 [Blastocatellia bacterium]|nr:hypothetical protein [Blastocatellia bacterium]